MKDPIIQYDVCCIICVDLQSDSLYVAGRDSMYLCVQRPLVLLMMRRVVRLRPASGLHVWQHIRRSAAFAAPEPIDYKFTK